MNENRTYKQRKGETNGTSNLTDNQHSISIRARQSFGSKHVHENYDKELKKKKKRWKKTMNTKHNETNINSKPILIYNLFLI